MAGLSLRSPWSMVVFGREASCCAFGEVRERVRAMMENWGVGILAARRVLITAPPCLPVAPVTRTGIGVSYGF